MPVAKKETLVCGWCEKKFNRTMARGRKPRFCSDEHRIEANAADMTIDLEETNRELKRRLRLAKKIILNSNIRPRKGHEAQVQGALQRFHAA